MQRKWFILITVIIIKMKAVMFILKYSRQREKILEYVKASKNHPTAEKIYESLKIHMRELSLATVYRNLNLLADNGHIKKIYTDDMKVKFDGDTSLHDHFVCKKCNRIVDLGRIDISNPKEAGLNDDFVLQSHELILYGICDKCSKKSAK